MATIEEAIAIAALAHKGISDKAGAPYIFHPLRMMFEVESTEAKIAAVLHDSQKHQTIFLYWMRLHRKTHIGKNLLFKLF